ncbi:CMRF35-like molecule 1 isoform X2 [Salarias fasciatus]|nr:CMRF35-like molecule 1 isoform X2 [Salarias fasciatus]
MIHDDQSRQVFTVTITDLQPQDASYYWCAVERKDPDIKQFFKLSVTTGVPGLHVDNQEVKGFMGEDLTISCYCSNTGESQWCRLGGPCVKGSAGEIDSTSVIINNNHDGVFTVTMKRLRTESSGWYFCASEGLQMPVHVTVEHRPPMTTKVLTTFSPTSESVSLTTVSATSQVPTTVQHGGNSASGVTITIITIIIIVSLIFIAMVNVVILLRLKKRKKSRTPPATTAAGEITYSEVRYKRKKRDTTIRSPAETNEDVTYSTVVIKKKKKKKKPPQTITAEM